MFLLSVNTFSLSDVEYYHNTEPPPTGHLISNIPAEEARPGLNRSSHAGGGEERRASR